MADKSEQMLALLRGGPNVAHAYISYCRKSDSDQKKAKSIENILKANGFLVYGHNPDKLKKDNIDIGVHRSRKIIILASNEYINDSWSDYERHRVVAKAKNLTPGVVIVVLLGLAEERLPSDLKAFGYIKDSETSEDFENALVSAVYMAPQEANKNTIPKDNLGAGFAYAYFNGYLKIILPGMVRRIKESGMGNNASDPQKQDMCTKFIIIVPESCYGPPDLSMMSDSIEVYGHIPYNVDRGGQVARCYKSTVYKITKEEHGTKRYYLFLGEIPSILVNFYELVGSHTFGFCDEKAAQEMQQFFYYLQCLVNDPANSDCKDQVLFVYRKDERATEALTDALFDVISSDVFESAKLQQKNAEADATNPDAAMETDDMPHPPVRRGLSTMNPVEARHVTAIYENSYISSYPLGKRPSVGTALIINNSKFSGRLPERLGSDIDEKKMIKLLKDLHFEVETRRDLSAAEIMDSAALYSSDNRNEGSQAVAVVLMSHGRMGQIFGRDENPIDIIDIAQMFASCASLKGKPKFFFVQACQIVGHRDNTPRDQNTRDTEGEVLQRMQELQIDSDAATADYAILKGDLVPGSPDFIMSYASLPGMKAFRHETEGSFYVKALDDNVRRFASSLEIDRILKKVTTTVREVVEPLQLRGLKPLQIPFHLATTERLVHFKF